MKADARVPKYARRGCARLGGGGADIARGSRGQAVQIATNRWCSVMAPPWAAARRCSLRPAGGGMSGCAPIAGLLIAANVAAFLFIAKRADVDHGCGGIAITQASIAPSGGLALYLPETKRPMPSFPQ